MSILKSLKNYSDRPPILLDPQEYRNQMSDIFLAGGQGSLKLFQYQDCHSAVKAYEECPPLASIINKKAQAYINGEIFIMDQKEKESNSAVAKRTRALLEKPNLLQTRQEFEAQQYVYQSLFSFSVVLFIIPAGFKGVENASAMWNIPPNMLKFRETGKIFSQVDIKKVIQGVTLTYNGNETDLDLDSIAIFKDFTPSFHTLILPESRVKAVERPINNIIGAYESRNVLINYRGALGILSSDSDKFGYVPIKDGDKKSLQQDFLRYGLKDQQWKFIITSAAVKWQQMGIATKDLMLFEEIEDDIDRLCDQWNYPPYLMGSGQNSTFNNVKEAKAALYQDTIIPESINLTDQWSRALKLYDAGLKMIKDFSKVPVLQADKVNEGRARLYLNQALLIEWQNNLITANQWLAMNGMDTIPDGDLYYYQWVAAGKVFTTALPAIQNESI